MKDRAWAVLVLLCVAWTRLSLVQTTTHALIGLADFQHKPLRRSGWAAFIGAILPDAFMGVFLANSIAKKNPGDERWSKEYFQEPWQKMSAISNSFPLWTAALASGAALRLIHPPTGALVTTIAKSGLSHITIDFLTHSEDAHQHFWPLSDWRYNSPVSYWNVNQHANKVMPVEGLMGLAALKTLWPRTSSIPQKIGLAGVGTTSAALLFVPAIRRLICSLK